VHGNVSLIPLS